nr:hypothetical protein [Angustibacter aerolatus]
MTAFAETLERVCIETVESGKMTKDLAQAGRPRPVVAHHRGVPRRPRREPVGRAGLTPAPRRPTSPGRRSPAAPAGDRSSQGLHTA